MQGEADAGATWRAAWMLPVGWVLITVGNAQAGLSFPVMTLTVAVGTALVSVFLLRWRRTGRPTVDWPPGWALVALVCATRSLLTGVASDVPHAAVAGGLVFVAGMLSALAAHQEFPRRVGLSAAAWALAVAAFAVGILAQPDPSIDVFHFVSQAVQATASGHNPYAGLPSYPDESLTDDLLGSGEVWLHPYPYLPASAVLLAPAQALLGDYRWCLLLALVLVVPVVRAMTSTLWSLRVGFLLLAAPGWQRLAESGWIDPLLLLLAAAAVRAAWSGDRSWAGLWAGVMVATKQYALVPLGVLTLWRPFGVRAAIWGLAVAAATSLPFLLGEPGGFLEGTTFAHTELAQRSDAVTIPTVAASFGWTPPQAVCLVVLAALLAGLLRRPRSSGEVFLLCGVAMSWSFLLSGHAFYNYYWLVAGFLTVAAGCLAVRADDGDEAHAVRASSPSSGATAG